MDNVLTGYHRLANKNPSGRGVLSSFGIVDWCILIDFQIFQVITIAFGYPPEFSGTTTLLKTSRNENHRT